MGTNYRTVPNNPKELYTRYKATVDLINREADKTATIPVDELWEATYRFKEQYNGMHIGKSSAGWVFGFRAYPEIGLRSWADWKAYLIQNDLSIISEYNEPITIEEFENMIKTRKWWKGEEAQSMMDRQSSRPIDGSQNWQDSEGFDFSDYEFS